MRHISLHKQCDYYGEVQTWLAVNIRETKLETGSKNFGHNSTRISDLQHLSDPQDTACAKRRSFQRTQVLPI